MNIEMGEQILTMSGIHLSLNEDKSLQITCYGRLRWRSEEMEVTMPYLQLTADRAISIVDPEIRMSLKGEEMTFTTPRGKAESLSGEAEVVYDRDKRLLTFNSARLSSENLTLKQGNGSPSPAFDDAFQCRWFCGLLQWKSRCSALSSDFEPAHGSNRRVSCWDGRPSGGETHRSRFADDPPEGLAFAL